MKKIFGFIFADDMEFKPFLDYATARGGQIIEKNGNSFVHLVYENIEIYARESGIGKVNAALAALELYFNFHVDAIMSAGLSGAISGLRKGDVVAGDSYVECDFDLRAFGYPLGKKPAGQYIYAADETLLKSAMHIEGMQTGRLGTGDFFLTDTDKKNEYKNEFKINAFDMESAAIAAACDKYKLPFLSVRKISDDADDEALESYREMNNLCEETLTEILIQVSLNYVTCFQDGQQ